MLQLMKSEALKSAAQILTAIDDLTNNFIPKS
jgi:hypothetical protein